jgi:aspartate 1-decarboxylase
LFGLQNEFIYRQLIFQHSAAIQLVWASHIIIIMTFPSSEMKQESIHEPKFICYSNMAESTATITLRQEIVTAL